MMGGVRVCSQSIPLAMPSARRQRICGQQCQGSAHSQTHTVLCTLRLVVGRAGTWEEWPWEP